jgi:peptide/nickel transport system substrate-binding protein
MKIVGITLIALLAMACQGKPAQSKQNIIVIGVNAAFEEKWNPFLAESYYDKLVMDQVFVQICQLNDKNELTPFAGTITGQENPDHTVRYTVAIQKGMHFTNGQEVKIDDYIWTWHVLADPSYTGPSTALTSHIEGLESYYYDDPNYAVRLAAMEQEAENRYGPGITLQDFLVYAQETNLDGWWKGNPAGAAGAGKTWSQYAEEEGFGAKLSSINTADPDAMRDLIAEIEWTAYRDAYDTRAYFLNKAKRNYAMENIAGGVKVKEISGIKKIDDYTCEILMTKINIYGDRELNAYLIPKAYYGEITKGDVSKILSNMSPVGSGPFMWRGFTDNIATCAANPDFFLGAPKVSTLRWQFIPDTETISALASGALDIAEPTATQNALAEMSRLGISYHLIDNAGYGYLAMNTERVPLNVRKGYWCLLNRGPSVEGYFGPELAAVIERPMTTTVPEYPVRAAQYYPYSKDEALKYFQAAGYSQVNGKLVNAGGNQLVLNTYIGGSGEGNHPGYAMLVQAAEIMRSLGGEIQIQDVAFNVLQGAMNDGAADAWIMAWASVWTCDKTAQFHSTGGQNRYRYKDAKMDALLEQIVRTIDLEERRVLVAQMLDYAMDQCLEFPLYQRKNCIAYSPKNLDMSTIPQATTSANYTNVLYKVAVK